MFKKLATTLFAASLGLMAESIVKNGFFDEGKPAYGDLPPSWTMEKPAAAVWEFVDDDGVDSVSAVRFSAVKDAGKLFQNIKLKPATDYTLLFWYKCDGVAPSIAVKDAVNSDVVRFSASDNKLNRWQHSRLNFRTGEGTDYKIQLDGDYKRIGTGKAFFDAIEILPKAEAAKKPLPAVAVQNGDNLALNKKYTMAKAPDYHLCKDADDAVQLTDGGKTVGYFWTQKSTVGWHSNKPAIVIIDLEKTEPICGVSWSCAAAATAGVHWPSSIWVLVSEDKTSWQFLGDLVPLGIVGKKAPDNTQFSNYTYETRTFKAKGRYVALIGTAPGTSAIFCDEIEVYRGSDDFLKTPLKNDITAKNGDFNDFFALGMIRNLLTLDLEVIDKNIKDIPDSFAEKTKAQALAEECSKEIFSMPMVADISKMNSEMPLGVYPLSSKILALNAYVQRAKGFTKPFVWKSNRWENLSLIDNAQDDKADVTLSITMMRGEVRSEAFSIANPTDNPQEFTIDTSAVNPSLGIRAFQAVVTGTKNEKIISSALRELAIDGGKARVTVPAGCNVQIWLMCYKPTAKAGKYTETVKVVNAKNPVVKLDVEIVGIDFPKDPQLNVGGWEYAGTYNAKNRMENIAFMREIGVNSTWTTTSSMPMNPKFDEEGRLTNASELNFSNFDRWIKEWPGAHFYCIAHFLSRTQFFGEKVNTPRYERMIIDYYKALEGRMTYLNLKPEQLVYLYHDEPSTIKDDMIVVNFMKVIRKEKFRMQFFQDPTWSAPEKGVPEAFSLPNILCPNTPMMVKNGQNFRDFYNKQREDGRTIWLYSCSGPAKQLDPLHYWRGQAWQCQQMKAWASFFWAFGDTAGAGNSWNVFTKNGTEYSPYFVEREGMPTDSKQAEAIRESVADFEYMKMLETEIARAKIANPKHPALAEAEKALAEAPAEVVDAISVESLQWQAEKDYGLLDRNAVRLLKALVALRK